MKSISRHKASSLLLAVILCAWSLPGSMAQAQQSAKSSGSDTEERLSTTESVVVQIVEETNEFQEAIQGLLVPPTEEIKNELARELEKIRQLIPDVVRNPDDRQAQAQLEQATSSAVALTAQNLLKLWEQRPAVMDAIDKARAAGEKAHRELEAKLNEESALIVSNAQQLRQIDDRLEKLANQFPLDDESVTLPAEMNSIVRTLHAQAEALRRDIQLSEAGRDLMKELRDALVEYGDAVDFQKRELVRAFDSANSTQMHLSHVSRLRVINLQSRKTAGHMKAVGMKMAKLNESIAAIIEASGPAVDIAAFSPSSLSLPKFAELKTSSGESGVEILRKIRDIASRRKSVAQK